MKHNPNSNAEPSRNSQLAALLAMARTEPHQQGERGVASDEPEIEKAGSPRNGIPQSAAAEMTVGPEGVMNVQKQQLQLQQAQQAQQAQQEVQEQAQAQAQAQQAQKQQAQQQQQMALVHAQQAQQQQQQEQQEQQAQEAQHAQQAQHEQQKAHAHVQQIEQAQRARVQQAQQAQQQAQVQQAHQAQQRIVRTKAPNRPPTLQPQSGAGTNSNPSREGYCRTEQGQGRIAQGTTGQTPHLQDPHVGFRAVGGASEIRSSALQNREGPIPDGVRVALGSEQQTRAPLKASKCLSDLISKV